MVKLNIECSGNHRWQDGWSCCKCGIRRADYEDEKRQKKAEYWLLRYGEKRLNHCDTTLYKTARDCREKIAWNLERGNPMFRHYQIIRHAKDGTETVYDEYPLPRLPLGYRVPDEYDEQF